MHLRSFNSGASIEVETGLSLFDTGDSWVSATVSETVPDRSIELGGSIEVYTVLNK